MRFVVAAVALATIVCAAPAWSQNRVGNPEAPRPIAAHASLWTEDLTSLEIRDAIRAGTTTIIIGTGGVEHNGPYVVTGKHNYVLQTVLPYVAREIGHALIAPVVKFVPEGPIDKADGHMAFAGTISVEPSTFRALVMDICRSYKAHGFLDIILVGDSGGNQAGLEAVAAELNQRWQGERARVHYLREYYYEDMWSDAFLKRRGVVQINTSPPPGVAADQAIAVRNGIHDDVAYEAQVAVQDPVLIRADERRTAGLFSLHGVDLSPIDATVRLGHDLAQYRAGITAKAFLASQRRQRP